MSRFRKIELEIGRGNGYGQYYIYANYKGVAIRAHTTDSECFDWLNDDSDKAKHQEAKRHAYNKVVAKYEDTRIY